ncbi:hypothetical protein H072_6812 [Dactylellina haptotyla CBS 200.50]|uniref:Gamma-glutamyltransferase n=1 Tax=Dactylellina haptotyla (strain CBS 200.50) TaxID=1284197 RepID=S8BVT7_DACHA|nr:hypothetical protein H072_6812 [Dactylellina haptotyla CBS 200.50]
MVATSSLHTNEIYPLENAGELFKFPSRRSVVHSTKGIVSCTSPLACQAGIKILEKGGNAADAAIAVAAALNVTEPTSTGIGGDAFMLYWNNSTKKITALNGSGRSPSALTRDIVVKAEGVDTGNLPKPSVHAVTVPGAAAAWVDTVEKVGSGNVSLEEILAPAIDLAEKGYPVSEITAKLWKIGEKSLLESSPNGAEMLVPPNKSNQKTHAPAPGEIMVMKNLAETFRSVAKDGKKGFYEGRIAEEIVKVVQGRGGVLTLDDLKSHGEMGSQFVDPVSMLVEKFGVEVWEFPPNGQGIVALMALGIIEALEKSKVIPPIEQMVHNSSQYLHCIIEALRIAFADAACSNFAGFGSAIVPYGCGFTLQNRGSNFNLEEDHPNVVAPSKRPYHTIIPALITQDGELHTVYGVMGGFMQPQGHVQVLLNMLSFGFNPQVALDAPRICLGGMTLDNSVLIEEGIPESTVEELRKMGHTGIKQVKGFAREVFGRGQIIRVHYDEGRRVYSAGSDMRGDGQATPLI